MAQFLTLCKAMRLIGIKRTTLQKQIRSGELSTFEGRIAVSDLLRVYPDTKLEDNRLIERVEKIKEKAIEHRHREETKMVTSEVLAIRLNTLKEEHVSVKANLYKYKQIVKTINQKISDIEKKDDADLRSGVVALNDWLRATLDIIPI